MKFKIYQPYLKAEEKNSVDVNFEPFDNCDNPAPELREYYINLLVREIAVNQELDLWGSFSLRWKEKLPGCNSDFVIDRINNNPGYDVYFFNGFIDQVTAFYNVWDQGNWYHKNLVEIMEAALPLMNIDPDIIYQPMGRKISFYACYCVANKDFWDGYLELVNRFVDIIDQLPLHIQNLLCGPSDYSRDPTLWYFPFIQERLFSTYLALNPGRYNVLPYHHQENICKPEHKMLLELKDTAIDNNNADLLDKWVSLRDTVFSNLPNNPSVWVKKFKKEK